MFGCTRGWNKLFYSVFSFWLFCVVLLILSCNAHPADVTLAWDPNSEPDLAGYRVYYGTESRTYERAGESDRDTTTYTVMDLQDDRIYYFAVTAYNTSGNESDFSEELVFFPGGSALGLDLTWKWTAFSFDGRVIRATFRVCNAGSQRVDRFKIAFYLSDDGMTPQKLIRKLTVRYLGPGRQKDVKIKYRTSGSTAKYITAIIDYQDLVAQISEANNRAGTTIE